MEDLSGKLIIKVALGDDIRRIPIHNEVKLYPHSSAPRNSRGLRSKNIPQITRDHTFD
jgi:hypothetical protein